MPKKLITTTVVCLALSTLAYAQNAPGPSAAQQAVVSNAGAGGQTNRIPTQAAWDSSAETRQYVAKAKELAGNDADLQYDELNMCVPNGSKDAPQRAKITVPSGSSLPVVDATSIAEWPAKMALMPAQRMFDNFWWLGDSFVGSWLITTPAGYILFDASNDPDEAQTVIIDAMKKVNLDPAKIKWLIFGHFHLDHTGGGHLIQSLYHPRVLMGRDDWPLYFSAIQSTTGQGALIKDKTPMTHDIDAEDGMKISLGGTTVTLVEMTGHTPGSLGMIAPVKFQGKTHNILIQTAGTDIGSREAFIGGYEHIWAEALKAKVEGVYQVHPNINMNTLSRVKYVNDNYAALSKKGNNPLLYGIERTKRYIEIMRACTQARMAALGW